jgi:hypothetical protein
MSEAEWVVCDDLGRMHRLLFDRDASWRKRKLLCCACCRHLWQLLTYPGSRELVELTERYADGLVKYKPVNAAVQQLYSRLRPLGRSRRQGDRMACATIEIVCAAVFRSDVTQCKSEGLDDVLDQTPAVAVEYSSGWKRKDGREAFRQRLPEQQRAIADLVRDIFGNPFRPVPCSASWRTDTALTLARQMYESRDFGAMPILADALQDAGCGNADTLDHCRGPGPHVRGCWVVDLVLGKE